MNNCKIYAHFWAYLTFFISGLGSAQAQNPSTNAPTEELLPERIEVVKAYEPTLADAVKINFLPDNVGNLSQNNSSTTNPAGAGNIANPVFNDYALPNFFLMPYINPSPLKPLPYKKNTDKNGNNATAQQPYHFWLRAGYGNLKHLLGDLALANATQKYSAGIDANYNQLKGKDLDFQNFRQFGANAYATFFMPSGNAIGGKAQYQQQQYFYYGYNQADTTLHYTENDLKQNFGDIKVGVFAENTTENDAQIDYRVALDFQNHKGTFFDQTENNILTQLYVNKQFNNPLFAIGAEANAHFSAYQKANSTNNDYNNTAFSATPYLVISPAIAKIKLGASVLTNPQNKVIIAPYAWASLYAIPQKLEIYALYTKNYVKNNFTTLTAQNPFLYDNVLYSNALKQEIAVGTKGNFGLFAYNLKFYNENTYQQPLFVNTTTDPKFFEIKYDSLKTNGLHAEVGYFKNEKLNLNLTVQLKKYTPTQQQYAWHLPTSQLAFQTQYSLTPTLHLSTTILAFNGAKALKVTDNQNTVINLKTALDLNVAVKFDITPNIALFGNVNNIASSKYQRFYNYNVFGINALGGVLCRF